jgi:hypothetical protein
MLRYIIHGIYVIIDKGKHMPIVNVQLLQPGVTISYRLRSSQMPINPLKLWYGKVEEVTRSKANEMVGCCWVKSLEAGFEELHECVFFEQIVEVLPAL